MSETEKKPPPDNEEFSRFEQMAKALFRVDKRDVPKHAPKKRKTAEHAAQDRQPVGSPRGQR